MTIVSPPRPRSRAKRFEYEPAREVSVADVLRMTPDEWIGMAVTRYNDLDEPVAGFVIAHNRARKRLYSRLGEMRQLPAGAGGIFLFFSNAASVPSSVIAD